MSRKFFDTPTAKHVYEVTGIRNSLNPNSQSKVIELSYSIKKMNAPAQTKNGKANSKKTFFPTGETSAWHIPKQAANRIAVGMHLDKIPEGSVQDIEHMVESIKVAKGKEGKPDTHTMILTGDCLQSRKIRLEQETPFGQKKGEKIPASVVVDYLMTRKK